MFINIYKNVSLSESVQHFLCPWEARIFGLQRDRKRVLFSLKIHFSKISKKSLIPYAEHVKQRILPEIHKTSVPSCQMAWGSCGSFGFISIIGWNTSDNWPGPSGEHWTMFMTLNSRLNYRGSAAHRRFSGTLDICFLQMINKPKVSESFVLSFLTSLHKKLILFVTALI